MKRRVAALSAAGIFLMAAPVVPAMAAVQQTGAIVLNNDLVSSPAKLVQGGTTYMPVWYVMQALNKLNITSRWTGHAWYLTLPSGQAPDLSNLRPGSGDAAIYVNGKLVQRVNTIVATDPASRQPTTYMPIWYVMNILKRAHIVSMWDGSKWTLQTPDVKTLADAFANTASASESQITGTLTVDVKVNLKNQNQQGGGTGATPVPQAMHMEMQMEAETGTVNGEKAVLVTITPKIDGQTGDSAPQQIQEYVQGTRIWVNQGNGWTEETQSEELLKNLQAAMPTSDVNFAALRHIKVEQSGAKATYTASLDTASLKELLGRVLDYLPLTEGTSGVTDAEFKQFLDVILKSMVGSVQITVEPVNGGKAYITGEQLQLSVNIPGSAIPVPQGGQLSPADEIDSIAIDESMAVQYTYNDVSITPPAGIAQSPANH